MGANETKTQGKRRYWLLVIPAAIVAAAALFLWGGRKAGAGYTLTPTGISAELDRDSATVTGRMGSLMLRANRAGVQAVTAEGKAQWDIPYTMTHPYLLTCGQYALVADRGGKTAVLLRSDGMAVWLAAENTILFQAMNENGQTILVTQEEDGHGTTLYEFDGSKLLKRRTYEKNDGIPMAAALSADGRRMVTACLSYTGTSLTSVITVFDLSASGATLTDRVLGSCRLEGTLVTDLYYIEDTCIYLADNRIGGLATEKGCEEVWTEELTHRIRAAAFGKTAFAIALGEGLAGTGTEAEQDVLIYDGSGKQLAGKTMGSITGLTATDDVFVCGVGRSYTALDRKGNTTWLYDAGEDYRQVFQLAGGRGVAAVSTEKFVFYSITERTEEKG